MKEYYGIFRSGLCFFGNAPVYWDRFQATQKATLGGELSSSVLKKQSKQETYQIVWWTQAREKSHPASNLE